MLQLMFETVIGFEESILPEGTGRETLFSLSPGLRGGWNLGDHQLVLGLAMPITWVDSARDTGAFIYVSYELPFGR